LPYTHHKPTEKASGISAEECVKMNSNGLLRIKILAGAVFALIAPAARASTVIDFTAGNGATGEAVFTFGSIP